MNNQVMETGFAGGVAGLITLSMQAYGIEMTDAQFAMWLASWTGLWAGIVKFGRWMFVKE